MRIVHVCCDPGIPVFGTEGVSVYIQEITRELRAAGHEVVLYAPRSGEHVPADLADFELHLEAVADVAPAEREQVQVRTAQRIASRVIVNGVDLVYERYSLFSIALVDITVTTEVPGVLEVNVPLINEQRRHCSLVDVSGAEWALRRQVGVARVTVRVSDPAADWVRRRTADIPDAEAVAARVHMVLNGVSVRRIQPQPADPEQVVITFVGTFKPWHGVVDLIAAAALACQRWSLWIIDDGPEMETLRTQAERLGVEADFRGAVAPEEIPTHMTGSAIGVAPYLNLGGLEQQYFSPMKVLEYLAAGLTVVAFGTGRIPQLLEEGSQRHGMLVASSNPTALAAALDDLATFPQWQARMGRYGRFLAEKRYSRNRVATRILKLAGVAEDGVWQRLRSLVVTGAVECVSPPCDKPCGWWVLTSRLSGASWPGAPRCFRRRWSSGCWSLGR